MPAASAYGQQDVKITASAPDQAYVGDAIPFRVAVDGATDSSAPDVSAPPATSRWCTTVRRRTSSRMIVINGRMQQSTERRVVYTYSLAARRTGEVVIPAVAVRVDGREYQTQPLRIRLVEPSRVGGLSATLSHSRAYIGQPLRLTVTWLLLSEPEDPVLTLGLPSDAMDIYPLPAGATAAEPSPRVAEMDFVPSHGAPKRPVRGKVRAVNLDGEVRTEFSAEFLIVPRQAGQTAIGPVRCDFKAVVGQRPRSLLDSPFERNTITQRQYALAPVDTLEVLDLPSRGRPANFSGLVGSFLLDASCSPREASVGEPLTLNLMLRSPLPILNPPPVDLARSSPGTRDGEGGIATLFRVPRDPVLPQAAGEMTLYTAAIRARSTRAQAVPPIEINYFDPDLGQYKIARSPPVSLSIRPAAAVGLGALEGIEDEADAESREQGATAPRRADLPERINGWFPPLSAASSESVVGHEAGGDADAWLLATGVCVAALVISAAVSWRQAQRERDPARFRRRGAGRRARRAPRAARVGAPERIAVAMRVLVADLFNLDASSLTTGEAVSAVRRIDAMLASRLGRLLGACDQRLLGPAARRHHDRSMRGRRTCVRTLPRCGDAPRRRTRERRRSSDRCAGGGLMKSSTETCSRAWAWLPLALWTACVVVAAVFSRESLVFDARKRAAAHYDAGTRAAIVGDLGWAVLELRRAQSLHAPWWRDADALGARIDGNLLEARRRVAGSVGSAGEGAGAGEISVAAVGPAAGVPADGAVRARSASDRALAFVRSVPQPARIALAAAAAGLACALAASRLLACSTGNRPAVAPRWSPWLAASGAVALACAAVADEVVDSRRAEGVLVRPVLPRQGPDDLTYAPASLSPLPAGAEVRIVARTSDGLWMRIGPSQDGSAGRAAGHGPSGGLGWVPATAVEPVIPPREMRISHR